MALASEASRFIAAGREPQLERLQAFFAKALLGSPQVVLLTGEAGVGKTKLVHEFCRQAQEVSDRLVVAWGECATEHSRPYQPFVEILSLLTGDLSEKLSNRVVDNTNAERLKSIAVTAAETLVETGGDLIGILVPGAALLNRVVSTMAKALKVAWISKLKKQVEQPASREGFKPEQFSEQFSRVILHLAAKVPLILALDDLHWADNASLEMFFYLARRLQQQAGTVPLLLLGTYRQAEIRTDRDGARHPLERIVRELRRYWPDCEIDLDQAVGASTGRSFVDAFLDTEPNRLDEEFRSFLVRRTGGHPLFTVEIVRMLRERGMLVKASDGYWITGRPIAIAELPDSVEAVIEQRIDRLEQQLRDILTCGSVEGEQFTAEIVARVRQIEELHLAEQLNDELEKRYSLVISDAEMRAPQKRLHTYRFMHALFQHYLYGRLSGMQRQQLHRAVGEGLEELYGARASAIAVQLARHFDLAYEDEKAIKYSLLAADQAAALFANADAIRHYLSAREIIARGETDRKREEYYIARSLARLFSLQGLQAGQSAETVRMLELAQALGQKERMGESLNYQSRFLTQTGDYAHSKQVAGEALRIALETGDEAQAAEARLEIGEACAFLAEHDQSLAHLWASAEIWLRLGDRHKLAEAGRLTALVYLNRNDYAEALEHAEPALALFREIGDRVSEEETLRYLGDIHCGRGDYEQGLDCYQNVLRIRREIGNRAREGGALGDLGDVHLLLGNYRESLDLHQESLAIDLETGYKFGQTWCHHDIGVIQLNLGRLAEAKGELEQALALATEIRVPNLIVLSRNDLAHVLSNLGTKDNLAAALRLAREATETAVESSLVFGEITGRSYQAVAHLMLGNPSEALEQSRAAIALLETHRATEALPQEIYFNHSVILQTAKQSDEAMMWLQRAYDEVMAKGMRIRNPAFRESFLTRVPLNCEIIAAWQAGGVKPFESVTHG